MSVFPDIIASATAGAGLPATEASTLWTGGAASVYSVEDGASFFGEKRIKQVRTTGGVDGANGFQLSDVGTPTGDVEVLALCVTNTRLGNQVGVYVCGAGTISATGYIAYLHQGSGITKVKLAKYAAGALSELGSVNWSWLDGRKYWMRLQRSGNALRVRVWKHGSAEPSTWNIESSDPDLTTGAVGGFSIESDGERSWEYISAGTGADAAPTPASPGAVAGNISVGVTLLGTGAGEHLVFRDMPDGWTAELANIPSYIGTSRYGFCLMNEEATDLTGPFAMNLQVKDPSGTVRATVAGASPGEVYEFSAVATNPNDPTIVNITGAGTSEITVTGSAFNDPDGATHAASQWQLSLFSNFASTAYDSGEDAVNLISKAITIADLTDYYYVRVRYKDNTGLWTGWGVAEFDSLDNNAPWAPLLTVSSITDTGCTLTGSAFVDPDAET